ncbi:MAG TPA: hypothetical protein PK252_01975 [Bacteroidales bacterium]|nr:hypothetical protein [Bacteroidales bacterium]
MGFASGYFERYQTREPLINEAPDSNLSLVVCIPSYNENNIIRAIEALYCCTPLQNKAKVIILLNYTQNNEPMKAFHERQLIETQQWISKHQRADIQFHVFLKALPAKDAGVGLARKIAMDEALRLFNLLDKRNGIIVGYDADCTCKPNYLAEIESFFIKNPRAPGISVYFEHPTEGEEFEPQIYKAILQYELYLRYYIEALRYCGFPYAFQTLGSSFAVRADAYASQGGMNKRKAGEDFYFLHKIIPLGRYDELNTTAVYPSPRISDRVPFGTGAAVSDIISDTEGYKVFNPKSFEVLKGFFSLVPKFYKAENAFIHKYIETIGPSFAEFLKSEKMVEAVANCNANSSNINVFIRRFYAWFNGLLALQCLNKLHESAFQYVPVAEASNGLLSMLDKQYEQANYSENELLKIFRQRVFKFKVSWKENYSFELIE